MGRGVPGRKMFGVSVGAIVSLTNGVGAINGAVVFCVSVGAIVSLTNGVGAMVGTFVTVVLGAMEGMSAEGTSHSKLTGSIN